MRRSLLPLCCIVIVAAMIAFGVFVVRWRLSSKGQIDTSQLSSQITELTTIKAAVAEHILLPTDEEPVLATITEKDKITSQFLSKSENGDKVLLYSNAQRAIIYRPSLNKLIDVGPLNIIPLQ